MKLTTTLKCLFILSIMLLSSIITECNKISSIRRTLKTKIQSANMIHKLSHTLTRSKFELFDKIKEVFLKPENIFYFSIGAISAFIPVVEDIYDLITNQYDLFKPCIEKIKTINEELEADFKKK